MQPTTFDLEVQNYRSFAGPSGARMTIRNGLTALVGQNNSGKSNVLRLLYELRTFFSQAALGLRQLNAHPNTILGDNPISLNGIADPQAIFSNSNSENLRFIVHLGDRAPRTIAPNEQLRTPTQVCLIVDRSTMHVQLEITDYAGTIGPRDMQISSPSQVFQTGRPEIKYDLAPFATVFELLTRTVYIGSFRNLTNQGANAAYYDLVVGNAFIEQWSAAQGGTGVNSARAVTAVVKELKEIFGFDELQIIASHDRKTLRFFIDGQSFGVDELGSGVSQFLITLFNLETRPPALTLIDEPELGLHPQLQLDFITAIGKRSAFGVLFSTHNLGLARSAGDRVYTLTRTGPGGASILRQFDEINNPVEFIGELSYSGNYDLGYHKILLVEGPTEIKLFRRLLQRLGAAQRITLVSLGGSSLISSRSVHGLVELRRLSDQVFSIVDSERRNLDEVAIPERRKFKRNCERLGIACHMLERRSIESYFSEGAVQQILGTDFHSLSATDPVPPRWPKQLNWKIADAMELEDFASGDLVAFLRSIVSA